jgi:CubicO group peptidase (beta-lactamase class C family)
MALLNKLPRVENLIHRHVENGIVSGVATAWQLGAGDIRYQTAGLQEFHGARAMAADSLFRLHSQSKPITGIATMMLIEEGRLELDQPLHHILPEFAAMQVVVDGDIQRTRPATRSITIRHLLTHTAGLSLAVNGDAMAGLYARAGIVPGLRDRARGPFEREQPATLEEFCLRLSRLPLAFDPGTKFEYSVGTDVLGMVIQAASGIRFEDFLQQRIFDPLGMSDTSFVVPPEKLDRLTALYENKPFDGWKYVDDPRASVYALPTPPFGGSALVSSAHDYARFASMLAHDGIFEGRQLLRPDTVQLAMSNLFPESIGGVELPRGFLWPNTGFGAAMSVQTGPGEAPTGVCGWPGASGTGVWMDRQRRFFFVFLVQHWPPTGNIHLRPEIIQAAYADLLDLAPWLFDRT